MRDEIGRKLTFIKSRKMPEALQEKRKASHALMGLRGGGSTADWRNSCGFRKTVTPCSLEGEVGVTGTVGLVGGGYSR